MRRRPRQAARADVARRNRPRLFLDLRVHHRACACCSSCFRTDGDRGAPPPSQEIARRGNRRRLMSDALSLALGAARRRSRSSFMSAPRSPIGTQMAFFLHSTIRSGAGAMRRSHVPLIGTSWAMTASSAFRPRKPARRSRFYWGGAMVGRAIGSALLARVRAARLLAIFTAVACADVPLRLRRSAALRRASSRCASACSTRSCSR